MNTALLLIAAIITASTPGPASRIHAFHNKCRTCHADADNYAILTRGGDEMCLDCHRERVRNAHPSNFVPLRDLSPAFPLTNGKMVCTSCHFAHLAFGPAAEDQRLRRATNPYLLRVADSGASFCDHCHTPDSLTSRASITSDAHAPGLARAHSPASGADSQKMLSKTCIVCHENVITDRADDKTSSVIMVHPDSQGVAHPVNIDYIDVSGRKPSDYKPASSLDPAITLDSGKVGCRACHALYSSLPHLLVIETRGSKLCLCCHNM